MYEEQYRVQSQLFKGKIYSIIPFCMVCQPTDILNDDILFVITWTVNTLEWPILSKVKGKVFYSAVKTSKAAFWLDLNIQWMVNCQQYYLTRYPNSTSSSNSCIPYAHTHIRQDVTEWSSCFQLFLKTGSEGKPTVFLFADTQIKDESFMEDISMILNTGDVPNLFAQDEKAELIEKMQAVARQEVGVLH